MTEYGKIDGAFFDNRIYPHLGAQREEVTLGPRHGVDFGVVEVGDRSLVVATDPISIPPALGFERAAEFAFDVVCADVAVSGVPPAYLTMNFTLPPGMSDAEFATVWETIDREATSLGASVVAGHTARYEGCTYPWVGGATVMGVGNGEEIVRPDGARPGDDLLLTTGPAVEAVGLLTTLYGSEMNLPRTTLETARERLDDARSVRDALTAAAAGPVTAMHDATEGGVQGALCEMAESAGVRIDVEREAVPLRPGVESVCEYLGIDPWQSTSSGSLLITVDPSGTDAVCDALHDRETTATAIGTITEGDGAFVDGERIEPPESDPSWAAAAEFTE